MSQPSRVIVCAHCGAMSATASTRGWRGYRTDDPELDEPPALAFCCPSCSMAEFGRPEPKPDSGRGRRWRDAHKTNTVTFRVALATAGARTVEETELESAFEVVVAGGGWDVAVLNQDTAPPRVEFELEAQNQGHATRLAFEVLKALNNATPSLPAGWVLAEVNPA
jgi:hypothetical protein